MDTVSSGQNPKIPEAIKHSVFIFFGLLKTNYIESLHCILKAIIEN